MTNPLTDEDLKAIRERAEARYFVIIDDLEDLGEVKDVAAMHIDIDRLLDEIERLRAKTIPHKGKVE